MWKDWKNNNCQPNFWKVIYVMFDNDDDGGGGIYSDVDDIDLFKTRQREQTKKNIRFLFTSGFI